MNVIFKLFLAFNSTSLLIVVYAIKMGKTFSWFTPDLAFVPNYLCYLSYIIFMFLMTYVSLMVTRYLSDDSLPKGSVIDIEYANHSYLPTYLGYFFVALDVPNRETLIFVYFLIFLFTLFSQTLYFNPIFLIFRYHFYILKTVNNVKKIFITKKILTDASKVELLKLKRINDFTFIERT